MAIHATNAGMPVQGKIPNSQPTKPCPNTSELGWWQLGVEAVLAIHVSGAWPINLQGKEKHQTMTTRMPDWVYSLKWENEKYTNQD
jgi:hypothetical protein